MRLLHRGVFSLVLRTSKQSPGPPAPYLNVIDQAERCTLACIPPLASVNKCKGGIQSPRSRLRGHRDHQGHKLPIWPSLMADFSQIDPPSKRVLRSGPGAHRPACPSALRSGTFRGWLSRLLIARIHGYSHPEEREKAQRVQAAWGGTWAHLGSEGPGGGCFRVPGSGNGKYA